MCSRYLSVTDTQKDGQTYGHTALRSIASKVKNYKNELQRIKKCRIKAGLFFGSESSMEISLPRTKVP